MRFLTIFILLLVMMEVQMISVARLGWSVDLVLATLIAVTAFLNLHELLALILFSMWFMNWQPLVGPELLALGAVPVCAFIARKSSPWNIWASAAAFSISGVGVFYLAAGVPGHVFSQPLFVLNAILAGVASVVVLWLLHRVVGYREERRLFAR